MTLIHKGSGIFWVVSSGKKVGEVRRYHEHSWRMLLWDKARYFSSIKEVLSIPGMEVEG